MKVREKERERNAIKVRQIRVKDDGSRSRKYALGRNNDAIRCGCFCCLSLKQVKPNKTNKSNSCGRISNEIN